MISLARSGFGCQGKVKRDVVNSKRNEIPSASALISATQERIKCVFCSNFYPSQDCGKATTMTREEKKTAVLRKGLCLVCLKNGHMAKKCHSNVRFQPKTLVVRLKNGGRSQYVRALLDDGSHRSYIEKDLSRELRLLPSGKETLSQGLFGGNQTPEAEHYRYTIKVERIDGKFSCQMSVLDQSKICTTLPRVRDKHLLAELENHGIVLTDIGAETPPIRLLLGADVLGRILSGRIEVLKSGISAIETNLGWSILGSEKKKTVVNMVTFCLQNFEIPKIWELENLGIVDPTERKATKLLENETLAHFQETVKKIDNRYEVALPWLAGHPTVYDMYDVAESRLRSVTKRLLKENIFEAYDDVLR
ncbi:hypothetical protein AVEN_190693-1 [Araneus ventricosus]|uniref:Uncharacterized protein n=1 Tax=Araneus ventricosus TaxID=182803 RepID=A0A4Y2KNP9_ARAVE|nr:hypothetical protein AVEN_190693-1 [Araneus ventricosus]